MTTYLEITNRALRDINEVPMTEAQFSTARGVQQFTKDAVNRAYFDIANESIEWPWLNTEVGGRIEGTTVTDIQANTQWYTVPADVLEIDWHTVYLTDKDPDVVSEDPADVSKNLILLTYEQWVRQERVTDNQRTTEHSAVPEFIVRHPTTGKIGLSPVPDKNYFLEYFQWSSATAFSLAADVLPFPEEFENVILNKVRYYMWLFRENVEQAGFAKSDYKTSLASMKRIMLSNKSERMRAI